MSLGKKRKALRMIWITLNVKRWLQIIKNAYIWCDES